MWILMLLGQVVAISFAMNLSFLALLASPPRRDDAGNHRRLASAAVPEYSQLPRHHLVLRLSVCLALAVPGSFGRPHVLAFAPLLLGALQPAEPSWRVKAATAAVARQGGGLAAIPGALYEHPAVSSVGWDVICCWPVVCRVVRAERLRIEPRQRSLAVCPCQSQEPREFTRLDEPVERPLPPCLWRWSDEPPGRDGYPPLA